MQTHQALDSISKHSSRCHSAVARRVEIWFKSNARTFPWRNKSATRYQQIVSEVLLQQTRAETVARLYHHFFREFPSWKALARARKPTIAKVIKPLGLYNRRSESLSRLAKHVVSINARFPDDREQLEQIPAVGQYVASAILLFCHGRPEPLLDVNMARILERYFGPRQMADIRYDPYLQDLARQVVGKAKDPRLINWAILDLGALVCTARNPSCNACPLKKGCRSAKASDG